MQHVANRVAFGSCSGNATARQAGKATIAIMPGKQQTQDPRLLSLNRLQTAAVRQLSFDTLRGGKSAAVGVQAGELGVP